ncbi:MAG: hypothetical protein WDZ50_07605 [Woeseia sp.]
MQRADEKKAAKARKKREKVSFVQGFRNRFREMRGLGTTLVNEPRAFPGETGRFLKRSLRKLWHARGGGLYACGYVVTFIWLEIKTIGGEIVGSDSVLAFVTEQLFEVFFRLLSESFVNSILAFIWPAFVLQWSPVWGIFILVGLYFVFPRFIKPTLTKWLFDDDPSQASDADQS